MKRRKVLSVALLSALTFGSIVGMTSCGNDEGSDVLPDNVTVNWTGLETVYLNMGDTAPDPLAGVKATSSEGDELKVVLDSESSMTIDTGYPGTYTVSDYAETADGYPNGTRWSISLNVENKDSYTDIVVGDEIVVYYDGMAAETDPLEVSTVYAITLRTPADRAENDKD